MAKLLYLSNMIASISPFASLGIAAFFLVMSLVAIAASIHARRTAQAIAAVPLSKIGFAKNGPISFEGALETVAGGALVAPLTGTTCAWFHAKVEKQVFQHSQIDSTSNNSWHVLMEYTSAMPFLITDGTGTCAIFPEGADVTPTDKSIWYGPAPLPQDRDPRRVGPGESAESMLRIDGTGNHAYRYSEERIYAGDPLYVLGLFDRGVDDEEDDDDAVEFDPAYLSSPVDGVTDTDIAAFSEINNNAESKFIAMCAAAKEVTKSRIIARPSRQKHYLLSTTQHDTLRYVSEKGAQAALYIAAVPAVIAITFLWLRFSN